MGTFSLFTSLFGVLETSPVPLLKDSQEFWAREGDLLAAESWKPVGIFQFFPWKLDLAISKTSYDRFSAVSDRFDNFQLFLTGLRIFTIVLLSEIRRDKYLFRRPPSLRTVYSGFHSNPSFSRFKIYQPSSTVWNRACTGLVDQINLISTWLKLSSKAGADL